MLGWWWDVVICAEEGAEELSSSDCERGLCVCVCVHIYTVTTVCRGMQVCGLFVCLSLNLTVCTVCMLHRCVGGGCVMAGVCALCFVCEVYRCESVKVCRCARCFRFEDVLSSAEVCV